MHTGNRNMNDSVIIPPGLHPPVTAAKKIDDFLKNFQPHEISNAGKLYLLIDERSGAFYLTCHLPGHVLAQSCDTEATLEGDEDDEIYKLNREISEDETAYQVMEADAIKGRSFEDIVLEYDTSYRARKPLKVYGGQHRLKAITKAQPQKGATLHGVRVYFGLSREQKVEIATINNTAIAVPNDLLDRMREQLLGSELRGWCQKTGLLDAGKDFSDRRSPEVPTVRLARTLVLNFYQGKEASDMNDFHRPLICKSGGLDEEYMKLRDKIDWSDPDVLTMGKEFARLNSLQRSTVSDRDEDDNAEFARKALPLSVVASWGYAAGLFQRNPDFLKNL